MLKRLKKIFTIKELAAIMPQFKGTRQEAHKAAEKYGIPGNYVDTIRTMLGYSFDTRHYFGEEFKRQIIDYYKANPESSIREIYNKFGKQMGLKSKQSIYDVLKRNGLDTHRNKKEWTKMQKLRLLDCRDRKHMKFKDIAILIGDHSMAACHYMYYSLKGVRKPKAKRGQ